MEAFYTLFVYNLSMYVLFVYGSLTNMEDSHCIPEVLKTVNMTSHCVSGMYIKGNSTVVMIPESHPFHVLPSCLNCTVVIKSEPNQQIVASLYKLGTEASENDTCVDNRLDVYNGNTVDFDRRMSGSRGICGCKFPDRNDFKSTNNTLTLHLMTSCNHVQHGDLELVVSAVMNDAYNMTECPGEFECENGQCIDKNLVCNGEQNCKDNSDEVNCHARNGTCPGMFECEDGACVDKNVVCNGKEDCPDGSDEKNCHHHFTCQGKFECLNGHCIDKNDVCNGKKDCSDGSDETGCNGISRLLLYVLIGVAGAIFILLIVVVIILCCRYCCVTFRMATVYRRLS